MDRRAWVFPRAAPRFKRNRGVVERALEACGYRNAGAESAEVFYRRLSRLDASDHCRPDLAELVEENRKPNPGLDL